MSSRLTDAAIRGLRDHAEGNEDRVSLDDACAEALARGEEIAALRAERAVIADYLRDIDADFRARRPTDRDVLERLMSENGGGA